VDLQLDLVEAAGGQRPRLAFDLADELVFGLGHGQAGDAFQLAQVAVARLVEVGPLAGALLLPLFAGAGGFLVSFAQGLVALVDRRRLLVDRLFLLLDAALDAVDLLPALGQLAV
jgi:hypothetical protein